MTTATDPVLDSLAKFQDASLWEVRANVPVFDEHDEEVEEPVLDADGKPQLGADGKPLTKKRTVHFGEAELRQLADNSNLREEATGDACPLTLGHTQKGAPEKDQPEIVGFARSFRLGRFGPAGKLGVLADFWIKKDRYAEAMEYPRRSVELWQQDQIFDPIALLRRTPQRDLGLLTYAKPVTPGRIRYQMEDEPVADETPKTAPPPAPPAPPAADPDQALVEKLSKHFVRQDDACYQALRKRYEAESPAVPPPAPLQNAAAPSGTNTAVPGLGDEPARMQRDSEAIRYARLEQENLALKARQDALEARERETAAKYQRAEAERIVAQLEGEGFDFDRVKQVEKLAAMTPAQRDEHVAEVRKYHRRAPVGHDLIRTARLDDAGQKKAYSRDQVDRAVALVTSGACTSYEEALAKVG